MSTIHYTNIGTLYGVGATGPKRGDALRSVETLCHAFITVENGLISEVGIMDDFVAEVGHTVDLQGALVLPSFVDCHTHLIFAKNREDEFVDRLKGLSYQEIAERGGGILNSVEKLRAMSEDELFADALIRLKSLVKQGTGALEIKSGYGLSLESEAKMLRVARRLQAENIIPIKTTFLGAHAYPNEYKNDHEGYIKHIIEDMLPYVSEHQLADYLDAFCEEGYFSVEETERIVQAGHAYGIRARLHVNQFTSNGAVAMSSKNNVISVEHLEELSNEDLEVLRDGDMFAVGLPACCFFLQIPYTPMRQLIEANVPVVLASDYNPGSSPTGNLHFVWSLACIYMKMLPEEALNALTINAAHALELQHEVGSITPGKRANFMVSHRAKSINSFPYSFGESLIDDVYVNGVRMD